MYINLLILLLLLSPLTLPMILLLLVMLVLRLDHPGLLTPFSGHIEHVTCSSLAFRWLQRSVARTIKHLGVRLSPELVSPVWATRDIETDMVGLGESRAWLYISWCRAMDREFSLLIIAVFSFYVYYFGLVLSFFSVFVDLFSTVSKGESLLN